MNLTPLYSRLLLLLLSLSNPCPSYQKKKHSSSLCMSVSLGLILPDLVWRFAIDPDDCQRGLGGVEAAGSVRSFGILAAMGLGEEERFDLVDEDCRLVGSTKPRSEVHRDGDWHQAVHVWVLFHDTWRVVMQRRCKHKDSWPLMWDISAAGHVTAGGVPLETAKRELAEELGLEFPDNAFRYLFRNKQEFRG